MSDCKCENVSIYDGEHRCKECFSLFEKVNQTQPVAENMDKEYPKKEERLMSCDWDLEFSSTPGSRK